MKVERVIAVSNAELLEQVKTALNITGSQFDSALGLYIEEVKAYMQSGGVTEEIVESSLAVGCIARGVADLWNYGNGDTKLSEYFYQRLDQLRHVEVISNG